MARPHANVTVEAEWHTPTRPLVDRFGNFHGMVWDHGQRCVLTFTCNDCGATAEQTFPIGHPIEVALRSNVAPEVDCGRCNPRAPSTPTTPPALRGGTTVNADSQGQDDPPTPGHTENKHAQ